MRPLDPTDVARRPLPGTTAPTQVAFSPDGATCTFLLAEPGSLRQRLHVVDVATGARRVLDPPGAEVDEADLPLEERLRRERARELAVGITRVHWASHSRRVLLPLPDGLWVVDDLRATAPPGGHPAPRLVVDASELPGPPLDAAISDDGTLLSFVCADEVWVAHVDGDPDVRRITRGAGADGVTHGLAEYAAQEEMGRARGAWLSPDGTWLAATEVDERHIPIYRIVHQGSDAVGDGAQEDHRYPFAGAENARVRLGVWPIPPDPRAVPADPVWLDLDASGIGDDRYLARVAWASATRLLVQVQDRAQSRLDLLAFAVRNGGIDPRGTLLRSDTSDVWVNLHDDLRTLPGGRLLWSHERGGFRHLVVLHDDGTESVSLDPGGQVVTGVAAVGDAEVWATATTDLALHRHLFRVPLDGGPAEQVTTGAGVHACTVHAATGAVVDTWSAPDQPPVTTLSVPGRDPIVLHDAGEDPAVAELALTPPTLRSVVAADGTTPLHAAVYAPGGDGPHPLVVWTYGGPHAQLVTGGWGPTVALRAQLLAQHGFLVAVVDNRGSWDRGLAFEGAIRHRLGTVEVDDQVRLVEDLVAAGLADPERVGIYGWSYGGYLSAMCLARRPDVFRAACAGAPVVDWDGYDTHYTERYLGTPQANPEGYRDGAVTTHAEGLRDRHLLLIHGLIDENVHFRHTARLLDVLVRADIDHRLLLYPNERHSPRSEADRRSMEVRILEFFRGALGVG